MTGEEMATEVESRALEFINQVVRAMGLSLDGHLERTRDGVCVNLDGEGGDVLLARRGDRAKSTHAEQTIGPLNAYDRRIVHLAVAEDPDVASESVGDAAVKTVIISEKAKKP